MERGEPVPYLSSIGRMVDTVTGMRVLCVVLGELEELLVDVLGEVGDEGVEVLEFGEQVFGWGAGLQGCEGVPEADEGVLMGVGCALVDEGFQDAWLYTGTGEHSGADEIEGLLFMARFECDSGHFCVHTVLSCLFLEDTSRIRYTHYDGCNKYIM
jgi:hypothetical protein